MIRTQYLSAVAERSSVLFRGSVQTSDQDRKEQHGLLLLLAEAAGKVAGRHSGLWDDIFLALQTVTLGAAASLIFVQPNELADRVQIFDLFNVYKVSWGVVIVLGIVLIAQAVSSLVIADEAETDQMVFKNAASKRLDGDLSKADLEAIAGRLRADGKWKFFHGLWRWSRRLGGLASFLFFASFFAAVNS